jgi:putative PIN family toxin of toxin-antitoxin system
MPLLRVVFDCNVFLQALVNPDGAAGACLRLLDQGELELFVSAPVFAEITDVLTRPRVKQLAPALTLNEITAFLDDIRRQAIFLLNVPDEYRFTRDPKDEPYLNLAIAAGASFLVSKDSDLLDLMTKQSDEAREFRHRYPVINILTAPAFLAEWRKSQ